MVVYKYVIHKCTFFHLEKQNSFFSRHSAGYGLDDRGSRVRFPVGAGNFSLHYRVQNGSGDHLSNGYRGKAARS
jgi:hypothetical protein